jgi:hypothetical protein
MLGSVLWSLARVALESSKRLYTVATWLAFHASQLYPPGGLFTNMGSRSTSSCKGAETQRYESSVSSGEAGAASGVETPPSGTTRSTSRPNSLLNKVEW